jgi:hypothetical protein
MAEFALECSAFAHAIPARHSYEGEDISPPLRWTRPGVVCEPIAVLPEVRCAV